MILSFGAFKPTRITVPPMGVKMMGDRAATPIKPYFLRSRATFLFFLVKVLASGKYLLMIFSRMASPKKANKNTLDIIPNMVTKTLFHQGNPAA